MIDKLNTSRTEEEEATHTVSEGEGDLLCKDNPSSISRKTLENDFFCDIAKAELSFKERILWQHRFPVAHLLSKCTSQNREKKLFTHFSGFNPCQEFKNSLEFVLPELNTGRLIYWDS